MSILLTETPREALWSASLRDAAGLLAAYITPSEYGLSTFTGELDRGTDPFEKELRKRLDFGRATKFAQIIESLKTQPNRLKKKSVRFTAGEVLGTVHIPKYVISVATGLPNRIPVRQSRNSDRTPENQLIVEGLQRSLAICRSWMGRGGAEGKLAADTLEKLSAASRAQPWRDLMDQPRPPLRPLAIQVRNLVAARVIPKDPYNEISLLLGGFSPLAGTMAFRASAGLLALLVSSDPRFADKLFELLCLSWVINAISNKADVSTFTVFPSRLKGAKGSPVATALVRGRSVSLFFQSSLVLPQRNWSFVGTTDRLGAVFDILLRIVSADGLRSVDFIIDAKNRGVASESEVAYKMLGYKENVMTGDQRFLGLALFPSNQQNIKVRSLRREHHRLWLAHAPLGESKKTVRLLGRLLSNHRFLI